MRENEFSQIHVHQLHHIDQFHPVLAHIFQSQSLQFDQILMLAIILNQTFLENSAQLVMGHFADFDCAFFPLKLPLVNRAEAPFPQLLILFIIDFIDRNDEGMVRESR